MVRDRPGRTNRTSAERIYFALRGGVYKVKPYGLVAVNCPIPIEKQRARETETSRSSIDSPARNVSFRIVSCSQKDAQRERARAVSHTQRRVNKVRLAHQHSNLDSHMLAYSTHPYSPFS